ncbi:MAG: hypothetical protein ACRDTC_14915 [Pseudonocardiaceae bacterium]
MPGKLLGTAQLGGVAGFAVDPVSANAMIMSIGTVRTELNRQLARINYLKEQAKLGDLPEARKIADLDTQVAAGDQMSLEYALQRFHEAIEEADYALKIGMRNYEQIEAEAEENFKRMGHP